MPVTPTSDPIERNLERVGAGLTKKKEEVGPLYRMIGASRIPVSKHTGAVWSSRRDQGMSARKSIETNWDEAIRYYDNDQTRHRNSSGIGAGNTPGPRLSQEWRETENIVFSNCSIMVPMLYSKNPQVTVSHSNDANENLAKVSERLINKLLSQKNAPGLNFKTKARRMVLTALLTNSAFIKIGFTKKDDSSSEAVAELQRLSTELENAKSKKKILEVEGKISALEEKIALLSPSGPWANNVMPHRIIVDHTSTQPDGSDAKWMMEWDYLPTSYLNAVYGQANGEEIRSVYEPTHIMCAGESTNGVEETVNNFSLFKSTEEINSAEYGYSNAAAFQAAQHTKVWYIWDKVTRRVLMYADNNWRWPLWVWDDPLKLPRFFPYFRLWFHEAVNTNAPKGEVTFYLDQQDAINEINDEIHRGRQWAKRNVIFNKNALSREDVEEVLKGDDGTARGIDLPEGSKLEDHIFSFIPPALNRPEFFSTDTKFAAVNRITGINDAMRGAQFKTNTTNKAIENYQANTDIRVDERVDLIEDVIGDIAWNITMLCLMNWDAEDVAPIVGAELAREWKKITDPRDFETNFSARVEGGSSAKPNSREKKQQALQMGQILGQFVNAAPATVLVLLKVFERSFDEFVIEDEEWAMIQETMMASLQKAGGGPGEQQQQQQGAEGQPPEEQEPQPPESNAGLIAQVKDRIAKLPAAAQAKLEELVQGGMPPSEALEQIEAELQPQ